jgi:hypothetical protein
MAIAPQILISLVAVQVTVALCVELEHFVSQSTTYIETFLESFLGLKLVFLDLCLLSADLSHLQTEVTTLSLYDLHGPYQQALLSLHGKHGSHHRGCEREHRSSESLRHHHSLAVYHMEASHCSLEAVYRLLRSRDSGLHH